MNKFFSCLLILLISFTKNETAFCQLRPAIQWQKCLGGTGDDRANDVLINPDGTMIVVGSTSSVDGDVTGNHGAGDAWIVKLDTSGNIMWQKTIGGNGLDYFKSVIATYDNAYLCIGYTASNNGDVSNIHGNGDAWIVKVSTDGNIISSKCYGGSQGDMALEGIKTPDGAYAIMGTTSSSDGDVQSVGMGAWVFKINESGNIIWEKCLGGIEGKQGYDIIVSEDNNLYALASGIYNYLGGLWPNQVPLVAHPGKFYKIDNATGSSSLIASIGGDSAFAMCRSGNSVRAGVLQETYFHLEWCYDEDFYMLAKQDGSNTFTGQEIGGTFTRGCTNAFNDGQFTAPTHGLVPAETSSGIIAAGTYFNHNYYKTRGWISDISGFSSAYGGNGFSNEETIFKSVKVFPNGNDYVVVGYTNDNGEDISGNHGYYDCWVVRLSALNRITGNVFLDANNNNIKDPGELPYTHASVKSTKAGFEQRAIPYDGSYSNTVDLGTFTTTIALNRPYYTVTPVSRISTFTTYKNIDTANFAVHPIPGIIDYAVSLSNIPFNARPGFPVQYNFSYSNRGTTTLTNKDVVFIKDPSLQLINTVPPFTSIVGDSIKWNISSLTPDASGNIIVNTTVSPIPIVNINDTLESAIYIDSTADYYRADNYIQIRQALTGGFDPNDKQEIHGGFITPAELSQGDWLNYTIRFQNTGNDTAFNIIIRDTLDAKLEWDSIELVSSSHPYLFNIKNNKNATWTFSNIKLVDSIHNETLSHGYISYRIKPKSTLVLGDTIRNGASIYFDFNPAVATNTQLTIVRTKPVPVLWTGIVSTAWEDPANWSNGKVPDENTDVSINTGVPNYPVVNNFNATCRSLNVKTGVSVLVKTGYTLTVIH
ncbi:MAG: hypothetical protein ABI741_13375 [Ferruginibacter sp.]